MKRIFVFMILLSLMLPVLTVCSKTDGETADVNEIPDDLPEVPDIPSHVPEPEHEDDSVVTDFVQTYNARFGDEQTQYTIKGWGFYNGNPSVPNRTFGEDNYKKLSGIGFNTIRFYFGAEVFETIPTGGEVYQGLNQAAFDWIDDHVKWAKKYNMRIILNMHHSPGETDIGARTLFTHPDRQDRFVAIWQAIAEYFKDEPAIIGFDIINEPNCAVLDGDNQRPYTATFDLYQSIVQRTVDAIRNVNQNHIIFIERLWISGASREYDNSSPNDQRDGWQNVNGKYNFPDIDDDNYAYTYHIYEPRYVHQTAGELDDGGNRVYPSDQVAKWNENDPETRRPWEMNKQYLEYAYTIPLDYIRNEKGVPAFIGEFGIHVDNFEENSFGVNRGGRQWVLDITEIFERHEIAFSYHSYYIDEFHPIFNEKLEEAFKTAFGTNR